MISRRRQVSVRLSVWLGGALLVLQLASPVLEAQDSDPPQDTSSATETTEEDAQDLDSDPADDSLEAPESGDIDAMLRNEEAIFGTFESYAYDPGERRDPFRSLLVIRESPELQGPRPEGVPGLLIDEINLIGIVKTPKGYLAQVQAADRQKSFLLHEGEQLFDGEVVSIDENEVVFKQIVRDPTAVKPFRERVKVLNPS